VPRDDFAWLLQHGSGQLILPAESEETQLAALEEAALAPAEPEADMEIEAIR
jgi:hypothetical protein